MSRDDGSEFEGAEPYYAEHRPEYGRAVIDYLVDHFDLDGTSRVLDLGCGTGQIAVPLAGRVGTVVGVDPNAEMLRYARRAATAAGRENVTFLHGSDADLDDDLAPVHLVTVGRAFHRVDREWTLRWIRKAAEPGGGIALVLDEEWITKGRRDWQGAVYDVAAGYVEDFPERRDPAEIEYDEPWDELLADHGFDVSVEEFEYEREWDVDGVVGYALSLSFCSPAVLGEDRDAFEADLRETLRARDEAAFVEDGTVRVLAGTTGE